MFVRRRSRLLRVLRPAVLRRLVPTIMAASRIISQTVYHVQAYTSAKQQPGASRAAAFVAT